MATTHKHLRLLYVVLRDARPYHDPESDYEKFLVRRDVLRWIRIFHHYSLIEHALAVSAGT